MLKWLSVITLLALAAGVAVGAWGAASGDPNIVGMLTQVGHVGDLWLNLLRMTVIPLVFSLLVTGVASVADAASSGRVAARAIFVFGVLLVSATSFACVVFPLLLSAAPVDPTAAASFIARAGGQTVQAAAPPTLGEWLAALAPGNAVAAAAEGAILPLVVFALFFGFAATQLPAAQRAPMVAFFRAVADTMIIIVRWVLLAAPLGVFALALGVGLTAGVGIAGLILHYIVLVSAVTAAIVPLAFLFAFIWGRANPARFINATAPVLAVAISSRSSLASLPLMVERARDAMGTPERVANLVLPMAVAVFRMTSPVANLGVVFFCASVFGVELSPGAIIVGGLVAIAISIGSVGLPGEISFIASVAPICMAMGVPIELLGLLVAVEAVPDIFRTVGNVSGDMAATQIVARNQPATTPPEPAAA
ncbi:MAG: dicarboxylate/amino acid:cation symporter [Hyphomonadaceae bacterium]|jgi:Na+/H+-dicarboxylate symporter